MAWLGAVSVSLQLTSAHFSSLQPASRSSVAEIELKESEGRRQYRPRRAPASQICPWLVCRPFGVARGRFGLTSAHFSSLQLTSARFKLYCCRDRAKGAGRAPPISALSRARLPNMPVVGLQAVWRGFGPFRSHFSSLQLTSARFKLYCCRDRASRVGRAPPIPPLSRAR